MSKCKFEPIKDVHGGTSKSAIRINNAREENVGLKLILDNTI